ncbi:MAG: right-handed parallel beta-helix repeat-containing protein [Chitinophagaceae bacterium]
MKMLSLAILLLLAITTQANNYYFSQSGDDSRTSQEAQNQATPWKTLSRLNSFFSSLRPGDSVLFKRGEFFYGFITSDASGNPARAITFAAYGTGDRPVISGLNVLSGWVSIGNNKWETSNSLLSDSVNALTLNGVPERSGRYPNAGTANGGYLTYEGHVGNTVITDNELGGQNWVGGDIVVRKNRYILNRGRIYAQSGNSIFYTDHSGGYESTDNYGYFIQNHPATLDLRGEWCYDNTNRKVTIVMDPGEDPNNQVIKAAYVKTVVEVHNQRYLHFTDLVFDGANENAFDIYQTSNVELTRCTISNTGRYAVRGGSNTSLLMDYCDVLNSNNDGIYLVDETNDVFTNCTLKNTGVFPGMGENGENTYMAVNVNGSGILIANNTIDSTGYTALRFEGNNVEIRNNFINYFNFVKDDGGGIYTWTGNPAVVYTGRKITGNIVLNGVGAGKGTPDSSSFATNGIYVDETAGYLDIQGNTVANCRTGLFMHNGNNINLRGNTSYNNVTQFLFHEDHGYLTRNNKVFSNILFSKYAYQGVSELLSDQDDFDQFATFDSNYYCRPMNDKFHITTSYLQIDTFVYSTYDLPQWRNKYGFDINAKITGTQISPYTLSGLNGNNKFSNATFDRNIDSTATWSPSAICHAVWANGEKLDGGAMKVYFDGQGNPTTNSQPAYVIMYVGSVEASKQYILRFSLQGTKNLRNFQIYLRKEGDPFNALTAPLFCNLSTTRTENEFLISFPESQSNASIVFEANRQDSIFYIDNVKLYEANIIPTNPDNHIRFEYNASGNARTVDLNGIQYVDPANRSYSGSVTLAPWSSIILIKTTLEVLPVKFAKFTGRLVNKEVQLNWVTTVPLPGSYFEVERSQNQVFAKIGTVKAGETAVQGTYAFTDSSPAPDKNYYRIKEIDPDGSFAYSNIITINNADATKLTVWPNPVSGTVFMTIPKTMYGQTLTLSLGSTGGTTVLKKMVRSNGEPIQLNVASLAAGMYFAKIEGKSTTYTATFIKN